MADVGNYTLTVDEEEDEGHFIVKRNGRRSKDAWIWNAVGKVSKTTNLCIEVFFCCFFKSSSIQKKSLVFFKVLKNQFCVLFCDSAGTNKDKEVKPGLFINGGCDQFWVKLHKANLI